MKTKKETTGKLVKISDENHAELKSIAHEQGYKMEHLANRAIAEFIENLYREQND